MRIPTSGRVGRRIRDSADSPASRSGRQGDARQRGPEVLLHVEGQSSQWRDVHERVRGFAVLRRRRRDEPSISTTRRRPASCRCPSARDQRVLTGRDGWPAELLRSRRLGKGRGEPRSTCRRERRQDRMISDGSDGNEAVYDVTARSPTICPCASSIVRGGGRSRAGARSWVTSRIVPRNVQGDLQLFDRREVEVVGRLVEHEQVDLAGHQHGERRPRSLARATGVAGGRSTWSATSPNLASKYAPPPLETGETLEHPQQGVRGSAAEQLVAGLHDLAGDDTAALHRPRSGVTAAEDRIQQRRLARAVGTDDCDSLRR